MNPKYLKYYHFKIFLLISDIRLLKELPFYDELNIIKNKTVFSGYAQSYKIEIIY